MSYTLLLIVMLAGCSTQTQNQTPTPTPTPTLTPLKTAKTKDPARARELIAKGAAVVDVRTADEYADGHVASSTNIPVDDVDKRVAEIDKLVGGDKTKPVVVYCASGVRATRAKHALEADGYTNVVNGGGYDDLR